VPSVPETLTAWVPRWVPRNSALCSPSSEPSVGRTRSVLALRPLQMLAPEFAKLADLALVKALPATKQYFDPLFAGGLSPIRRTTRRGIIVTNRLDHGWKVPGDAKCKRAERRVHAQLLEEAAPVLCRVGTATREGGSR
jgi:hypothetical protein